jgi:ribosomal protein S18 acetylase RimI-like enzyme
LGHRLSIRAATAQDIDACHELFTEYQQSLGVSLCFQGFDRELAELPGAYVPPRGGLWIAHVGTELAGCVALRPLGPDEAEMKRLYVRPAFRGHRLGRALAELVIDAARAVGYRTLKLDTLPSMKEAQAMYEKLGFLDVAPYNDNRIEGVRFLALPL